MTDSETYFTYYRLRDSGSRGTKHCLDKEEIRKKDIFMTYVDTQHRFAPMKFICAYIFIHQLCQIHSALQSTFSKCF